MSTQREVLVARGRVPDLDPFIHAAGRQSPPPWLPRDGRDPVRVSERAEDLLSRGNLPDAHEEIIGTRRGETGAVRAPRHVVDQIDMGPQRNDLGTSLNARDGHRPVAMSAGEKLFVRAPCPCADIARMDDVYSQPGCVGVPDLDGAILSPGSHALTVGAKSH